MPAAGPDATASPIRILVSTRTHLVPGDEYNERCRLMKNLICRHHLGRDFDASQDRWHAYRANFGYDNRRCYFLVDHGRLPLSTTTTTTEAIPIVWYHWTGQLFAPVGHALPLAIKAKLDSEFPFDPPVPGLSKKGDHPPLMSDQLPTAARHEMICARLKHGMRLPAAEVAFLRADAAEAARVRADVGPKIWTKMEALCNPGPAKAGPQMQDASVVDKGTIY